VRFLQDGDIVALGIDGLGEARQRLRAYKEEETE
jgi:2-keto-4-pentenoate hydratase/2-oxohepta-3-ene-1,7-dioic acid hydratase in catechol pathway